MRFVPVLLLVLAPTLAYADAPRRTPLAEVLVAAVRSNPALAGSRLDVRIADDAVVGARGLEDWVLAADARLGATRAPLTPDLPIQTPSTQDAALALTLTRPLPGGGSIGLRASSELQRARQVVESSNASAVVRTYSSEVSLVFRQPLLRGWGGDAAPRTQLVRTRASREVTKLEATAAAANVVRDVVRAYWELGYARDDLEIRRQSLALAEEQLRVTRARIATGKAPESEGLAVGQAIASRRDELAQSEAALVARSSELRRVSGLELAVDAIELAPIAAPAIAGADCEVARELELALERSPELVTVRARGSAAAIEIEVTENGLLPQLDLAVTAGPRGSSALAREAVRETGRFDGSDASIELQFSIPLGNHAASAARDAATRRRHRVQLDEADLRGQVAAAVIEACTVMRTARTRVEALADAVALGDAAIAAEVARWDQGKSTNYDVMRRQADRADSALRKARAVADFLGAEAALDALTGAILPRYGVH